MGEKKENKKIKNLQRAQGILSLFLILLGMSLSIESVVGIHIPWRYHFMYAAALSLGIEAMKAGFLWMISGTAAFLGAAAFFCIKYQEILRRALREAVNQVLQLVNGYQGTEFLLWYLKPGESYAWLALLLFCILLGFMEGVFVLRVNRTKKHRFLMVLLPALTVASGLFVGRSAALRGVFLMLAGIFFLMLDVKEKGNLLLGTAAAFGFGIPVLLSGNGILRNQVEHLHDDWQARQIAFENKMLSILARAGNFSMREQSEYLLDNEKPVQTGKEIFRITVDYPVTQSVYIRGFVGGDYEDGRWKKVSRQEFSDWAQQEGGTESRYARIVQDMPYDFLKGNNYFALGKEYNVTLELKKNLKNYTLMPYFTLANPEQQIKADGALPPGKERKFQWNSYLKLSDYELGIAAGMVMSDLYGYRSQKEEMPRKISVWDAYEAYARETYTRLPQSGLSKLKAYALEQSGRQEAHYQEQMEEINRKLAASSQTAWDDLELRQLLSESEIELIQKSEIERKYELVRQMLWEDNWYSFDLKEVPQGEDYTEYFIFQQHKGYCVHFATAATLLFRMNDVPARYVSGYLLLPSDFKKNKDGTRTAVVTDERSHAWTEIFDSNIGFHPVEMTPPSYLEMLEGMEKGETLAHAVKRTEQEEKKEQKEEKKQQKEQEKKQPPMVSQGNGQVSQGNGGHGPKEGTDSWKVKAVCAAVFAACACVCVWRYGKWEKTKRQQRITQKDRGRAAREISKEMKAMLGLLGLKRGLKMDDREYRMFLEQKLPELDWERAFLLLQKVYYSQNKLEEEEYQELFSLYRRLEQKLAMQKGLKGWYAKYVKNYP